MLDFKSVVSDIELLVKFEPSEDDPNTVNCLSSESNEIVGSVQLEGATFSASSDFVFTQYKLWQTRPERKVGKEIDLQDKNIDELITEYEELFVGAYILSRNYSVKPNDNTYERTLDWLRATDFYIAPASTHFHDSVPGGLLVHSLKVYNQIVDLSKVPAFESVNIAEATLVALMHDWCKISYYDQYTKNVKDNVTGKWREEVAYRVNQKGIPLGHGVTSLYMAMRVVPLSVEQCLAIRWHMGRFNVCDNEENEYQKALAEHPMVFMMHVADQLSCVDYTK